MISRAYENESNGTKQNECYRGLTEVYLDPQWTWDIFQFHLKSAAFATQFIAYSKSQFYLQ